MMPKKKLTMHKYIVSTFLVFGLNATVFAGDNSQATLGDVKEALYKLIVQSETNDEKVKVLNARTEKIEVVSSETSKRVNTMESSSKEAAEAVGKKDRIDLYVGNFVAKNEHMLISIQN